MIRSTWVNLRTSVFCIVSSFSVIVVFLYVSFSPVSIGSSRIVVFLSVSSRLYVSSLSSLIPSLSLSYVVEWEVATVLTGLRERRGEDIILVEVEPVVVVGDW